MTVDTTQSRQRIADFLATKGVGVLATSDGAGKPHAATIYITIDRDLSIYFITKQDTQKCRNLQANPWAAIAVYDAVSQTTVQAEGSVVVVTDAQQLEWIFNDIWKQAAQISPGATPPVAQLMAGSYVVFRLSTPSLRMASFNRPNGSESNDIFETVHTQPGV